MSAVIATAGDAQSAILTGVCDMVAFILSRDCHCKSGSSSCNCGPETAQSLMQNVRLRSLRRMRSNYINTSEMYAPGD